MIEIEHIANLAKLKLEENEYSKYQTQIGDILTEIEKIIKVKINDEDIMISPSFNENNFFDDKVGSHINKEQAFKNSKRKEDNYIVVPKVIE